MKKSDKWSLTQVTMKVGNKKWRQFGIAWSMRESQKVIYQDYIIWFLGKGIRRKRIPGSQLQQFSTSGSSSTYCTRIILTSRQRLLLLLTSHHRGLDQQLSPLSLRLPNKSEVDQPIALTNELKSTELRLIFIMFLDEFG